ncbi:MAG: LTA synthase family protein [Clostridia bacterium]|nr:LTA synthase family protein [Clostridia bacterium]
MKKIKSKFVSATDKLKTSVFPEMRGFFKRMMDRIRKSFRYFFFPLLICYAEAIVHLFSNKTFTDRFIWTFLFSIGIGCVVTFVTIVFPPLVNKITTYVFAVFFTLMFEVQLVYYEIFKSFASLSSAKLAGQAVTNFTGGMFEGIRSALLWIILLLIPLIILVLVHIFLKPDFKRPRKLIVSFAPVIASFVVFTSTIGIMALWFSGLPGGPSLFRMFTSPETSTDTSVRCFGVSMTMFQEFRYMIFPKEVVREIEPLNRVVYDENCDQIDPTIDFTKLFEKAGDSEDLKALTSALSNMPVSKKNEYTGLCEGYNLISICAEAFCPEFIDPELTPTLYKLSTNGFVFENFYSTFPSVTTDGEYAYCMGLFPDTTRLKTDASFALSMTNYLPYCYGNVYRDNGGVAKAYHNYVQEFYFRNYTHPNMGYDFMAANSGLNLEITWPTSDYDMMVNSVDQYINSEEPFVAYYMTFSGHYQYTMDNTMTAKNWDEVKHLDYSDAVKAYIACNLELEKALTYLMERLEEAGKADTTMIILTTDHYPYGLKDNEYSELAGRPIEDIFDRQKNGFICYVPGIEPVVVDAYCSSVDILPTVLNLLGVTYDSRLLVGIDILCPESEHIAVISNGSFITDGIKFDSSTIKFYYDDDSTEVRNRAEQLYAVVQKRFRMSVEILNNNYYTFVFDRESSIESFENLTANFDDVDIMKQGATQYMLSNNYMDAVSDTRFGSYDKATFGETLDTFYRVAGKPEVTLSLDDLPFEPEEGYETAAIWAYEAGILTEDDFPYDLESQVTYKTLAIMLERVGAYFEIDMSVDEDALNELANENPDVDRELLRTALFCKKRNLMNDNGRDYDKVFNKSDGGLERHYIAEEVWKICSWHIFAPKGTE